MVTVIYEHGDAKLGVENDVHSTMSVVVGQESEVTFAYEPDGVHKRRQDRYYDGGL